MNIILENKILNLIDLSSYKISNNYFFNNSGEEHYRLLCYISTLFNNSLFIDIGTCTGESALAFGHNPNNDIISFDIQNYPKCTIVPDCNYIIDDYFKYINYIIHSSCILYDIPHYNNNFLLFCDTLQQLKYNGFIILDDIHYDKEKNKDWCSLSDFYKKIDITKYGHWSGTGIINFSDNINFELK